VSLPNFLLPNFKSAAMPSLTDLPLLKPGLKPSGLISLIYSETLSAIFLTSSKGLASIIASICSNSCLVKLPLSLNTINGSALAVGRTLIAIIENNYSQATNSIHIPEVLQKFMGKAEISI